MSVHRRPGRVEVQRSPDVDLAIGQAHALSQYAHHLVRRRVQLHRLAQDSRVATVLADPEAVTQQHYVPPARSRVVLPDQATLRRSRAESIQQTRRHRRHSHAGRPCLAGEVRAATAERAQRLQRPILLLEVEVAGLRKTPARFGADVGHPALHPDQLACLRVGQRAQDHPVQHRIDRRDRPDPDGQREHRDRREAGPPRQAPGRQPKFPEHRVHVVAPLPLAAQALIDLPRLAAHPFQVTEAAQRLCASLLGTHSSVQVLLCAHLEVMLQLLLHLLAGTTQAQ